MYIYHLGQPPNPTQSVIEAIPPITPNPTPHRSLQLVPHSHIRRTCNDGKTFASATNVTLMTPSVMNPGFIKTDDRLNIDTALNQKLKELLQKPEYAVMVRKEAIRVALVDLTGDKICKPQYAGYHSTRPIYSASTIKYAILYAAHQLLFDLNELTRNDNIQNLVDLKHKAGTLWLNLKCKPDIDWLFTFESSSRKVSPSEDLKGSMDRMIIGLGSDMEASILILRMGFEYIASVVWSSGLYHPTRKGMWIGNTFKAAPRLKKLDPACHTGQQPTYWARNPFGYNTLTALSAVTFFTLLAQSRLVNESTSIEIENFLSRACFLPSISTDLIKRAAKCGVLAGRARHDVAFIQERTGRYRYVFALLTTDPHFKISNLPSKWPWSHRSAFVADIDRLIRDNNP